MFQHTPLNKNHNYNQKKNKGKHKKKYLTSNLCMYIKIIA